MGTAPAIRTEGLTKHYGTVVALEHLDLEVRPGEIFGFLGPNGAGKSTTVKLLLGLLRPTAGHAWLAGVPVSDVERAHRSVGCVPGDVALWPQLTGAETLELLGNLSGNVDTAFREGRSAVLRRLLAREHLFATSHGRQHWEQPAREQVAAEVTSLQA